MKSFKQIRENEAVDKEKVEQILEASPLVKLVRKIQTTKRHIVAKSRAKNLLTVSKSAGDEKTAEAAMNKSKRYSNIAKGMEEGIVNTAANAKVRIFSSIDRKKKELYKNAVKEDSDS